MPRKHGLTTYWDRTRKRRKRVGQKKRSLAAKRGINKDRT